MHSPSSFDYSAALSQCLLQQNSNIARHTLANGEKVWVRRAGARNPAWRYRLLGGVARMLRLGVLTPVPNLGGAAGIATEAARLQALAAVGINVPPLLALHHDALMMGSIGQRNLFDEIRYQIQSPPELLQRWQLGLEAIAQVHQHGQYLSQAFARNLMYAEPQIGFIDFEDDPGSVLPLPLCQARDWLCYLHSSARLLQEAGVLNQAVPIWQAIMATEHTPVHKHVAQALRRLRPLHRLQARFWGNDTLRLAAMAHFASPDLQTR